jgi:hypothetical protein
MRAMLLTMVGLLAACATTATTARAPVAATPPSHGSLSKVVGGRRIVGDGGDIFAPPRAGTISGDVVSRRTGQPLENVTVVATSPALQGSAAELTDGDGRYVLAGLPPGVYEVAFYYGQDKVRRPDVLVRGRGAALPQVVIDDPIPQTTIGPMPCLSIDVGSTRPLLPAEEPAEPRPRKPIIRVRTGRRDAP